MAGVEVKAQLGAQNYAVAIEAGAHAWTADEPPALGGHDAGPAPFTLVLAGLAACTAITLKMYAERKAMPLTNVRVSLKLHSGADRRQIERSVEALGDLNDEQIARLRDIVERTPVTLALKQGFDIATQLDRAA